MSIHSVDYSSSQSIGSLLMQQLLAEEGSSGSSSGLSSLDDLLSISPTGQQLSQAPDAVMEAMSDLFAGQGDVQGDLATLQGYFQENPASLASVLGTLQGGSGTYNALGGLSGSSDSSMLAALLGAQSQGSLLDYMGDSGSGSSSSSFSLLG